MRHQVGIKLWHGKARVLSRRLHSNSSCCGRLDSIDGCLCDILRGRKRLALFRYLGGCVLKRSISQILIQSAHLTWKFLQLMLLGVCLLHILCASGRRLLNTDFCREYGVNAYKWEWFWSVLDKLLHVAVHLRDLSFIILTLWRECVLKSYKLISGLMKCQLHLFVCKLFSRALQHLQILRLLCKSGHCIDWGIDEGAGGFRPSLPKLKSFKTGRSELEWNLG